MLSAMAGVACKYLLFERENETMVRQCLAEIAQERHNEFHTKEGRKGDGSIFTQCQNEICVKVSEVLNEYRKPAIEFNQITAELMETKFDLNFIRGTNTVVVSLRDKNQIDAPPILPDELLQPKGPGINMKVNG